MTAAMRMASPALARRSSGLASPRSAKTLPLPTSTSIALAMLLRSFAPLQPSGVCILGSLEARLDQVDLRFRCLNSRLRFLLEGVEYVHAASQTHGVDGTICITRMVLDNLQDSRASEASKWFRAGVLSALLGHVKCKADRSLTSSGKARRSALALPIQTAGLIIGKAGTIVILCLNEHKAQSNSHWAARFDGSFARHRPAKPPLLARARLLGGDGTLAMRRSRGMLRVGLRGSGFHLGCVFRFDFCGGVLLVCSVAHCRGGVGLVGTFRGLLFLFFLFRRFLEAGELHGENLFDDLVELGPARHAKRFELGGHKRKGVANRAPLVQKGPNL